MPLILGLLAGLVFVWCLAVVVGGLCRILSEVTELDVLMIMAAAAVFGVFWLWRYA